MSRAAAIRRGTLVALAALAIGLLGAGFARSLSTEPVPEPSGREIVLVARNMAYYLPGDPRPNPTLVVAPGETLRLVLINEDAGMQHDVALPGLDAATRTVDGRDTATVRFRSPRERGDHAYLCTLHPKVMRGVLAVR